MSITSAMQENPVPAVPTPVINTQWYRCDSRIGELVVGVDAGVSRLQKMQGPGLLLEQAILLSEVELTLQAFELWQGVDLDLVPLSGQSATDTIAESVPEDLVELQMTHGSLPDYLPTRFRFTRQALPNLVAIDEQLTQSLALRWSSLPVEITLDRFNLAQEELHKITPGACILLPASFNSPWQASVKVPGIGDLSFSALIDPAQKRATLCPPEEYPGNEILGEETTSQENTSEQQILLKTSVMLGDALTVSPAQVLGDVSGKTLDFSNGSAAVSAQVFVNGSPVALGAIGEVGRGHAVYVTQLLAEN